MFKHRLRCSSQLLNLGDRLCEQVIKKRSAPKLKSSPYNMNLFQQSKTIGRLPRALVIFVPTRLFLLDLTPYSLNAIFSFSVGLCLSLGVLKSPNVSVLD